MKFPKGATVAVSDGRTLRLFRNEGDESTLALKELQVAKMHPHNTGGSGGHQSSSGNPDNRGQEEDSYASATAELLNQGVLSGEIKHLYVVAPPRTLGELRKQYHAKLRDALIGEMHHEHTQDSVETLQKALSKA
jgi:protein required for attachment to host cells